MNNLYGSIYGALKTHKSVEEFTFELSQAMKYPALYGDILASMGRQLHEQRKPLSYKQIRFAQDLLDQFRRK